MDLFRVVPELVREVRRLLRDVELIRADVNRMILEFDTTNARTDWLMERELERNDRG